MLHKHSTSHIYTDSQAAIKAIDKPRRQSGQAIIKEVLDCIDKVTNEHPRLLAERLGGKGAHRALMLCDPVVTLYRLLALVWWSIKRLPPNSHLVGTATFHPLYR